MRNDIDRYIQSTKMKHEMIADNERMKQELREVSDCEKL